MLNARFWWSVFVGFCAAGLLIQKVQAQSCTGGYVPDDRVGGFSGSGNAILSWDPDGEGPSDELMVFAGQGTMFSRDTSTNICTWNPATGQWGSLNGGTNGRVYALTIDRDGRLVAGGIFTSAGGVAVSNIAAWNGTSWAPLGTGVGGDVYALATLPNGDIIAGGGFTTAGGAPAARVARWNGTAWSSFPSNATTNNVLDITPFADGTFAVCGSFVGGSGTGVFARIAKWDGAKWVGYGQGMNNVVTSIETLANGELIACGEFTTADAKNIAKVAQWNGATWVPLNTGLNTFTTFPKQIFRRSDGSLFLGATIGSPTPPITRRATVFSWSGTSWEAISMSGTSTFNPHYSTECLGQSKSGKLFAGGTYGVNTAAVYEVGSPNGIVSPSVTRFNGTVSTIAVRGDEVFYGGQFTLFGGIATSGLAKRVGETWTSFGDAINGTVNAVLPLRNGDVVVTGNFTLTPSSGPTSRSIGLWRNGNWVRLAEGLEGVGNALVELPNGDILVGGLFSRAGPTLISNLARWNGTSWSAIPNGQPDDIVYALVNTPDGGVAVGGRFVNVGPLSSRAVAIWNGTTWRSAALGTGAVVRCLAIAPNAQLIAGGAFSTPFANSPCIARFDGTGWGPIATGLNISDFVTLGSAAVLSLAVTTDGKIIAVGNFDRAGTTPIARVAMWNFSTWESLGTPPAGSVDACSRLPSGNVVIAGAFTTVNGYTPAPISEWYEPRGLSVTENPVDLTSCGGSTAQFQCGTDGNGAINLQWQVEDPDAVPFGWRSISDGPLTLAGRVVGQVSNTANRWAPLEVRAPRGITPLRFRVLLTNACAAILSRSVTLKVHAADFNCDNIYDDLDFQIFSSAYDLLACDDPAMPSGCPADLNADGVVDDQDFGEFIVAYNAVIPQ